MVVYPKNNPKTEVNYLTGTTCLNQIVTPFLHNLPIRINGSFTPKLFFEQLISLAINRQSVHSGRKTNQKFLSDTALYHHLNKFTMGELIEASYPLLWETAKKHLPKSKEYEIAIDYTYDPYYGDRTDENRAYINDAQRKKSTHKFYAYATLSIVNRNEKFILAALPLKKEHTNLEYVQLMLTVLDKHKIRPKVIYMDGGFYGKDVFAYLESRNIPFVCPMPLKRGRIQTIVDSVKKTQTIPYEVRGKHRWGNPVPVKMGVIVKRVVKKGEKVTKKYLFAYYGVLWSAKKVSKMYEHRFSIEATYRIRNDVKPRTSTRNPIIRYLFALVSFVIENVWVALHNTHFIKKQRGPKVMDEDMFRLECFKTLVNSRLRRILKEICCCPVLR